MTYPKLRFVALLLCACGSVACADDVGASEDPGSSEGSTGSSSGAGSSSADGSSGAEPTGSSGATSESSGAGSSSEGSSSEGSSSEGSSSSGSSSSGSSEGGSSSSSDDGPVASLTDAPTGASSDDGAPVCACVPGEYCDWSDDMCGDGEDGVCVAIPDACDDILAPVCGCDGEDYTNDCEAAAAGIDVAYEGMCALDTCDCVGGEYCELPVGQCVGEDGVCEELPIACGEIYAPVCGCNGVTYSNECEAAGAGVNVDHDGTC